jgi:glycosyltransferase involved in cell wall biosynthesis
VSPGDLAHRLAVAWRVLRAEGPRAVRERALDRLAEARRRRSFAPAAEGAAAAWPAAPVLVVSATAPAPRLGGVAAQLFWRLAAQAALAPVALLYPDGAGYRLEVAAGGARRALRLPGGPPPGPATLAEDAPFERAVESAAVLAGARAVHVEGLAGLPLASLLALRRAGLALALALHDFAAFCPRPHLLERPDLRFCRYSRDRERCGRCLAVDWPVDGAFQAARRELAAELLASAEVVVHPSEFLRRAHLELFPGLAPERQRVIAPAAAIPMEPPRPRRARDAPPRHVALVGGVQAHKGAEVFAEVVARLAGGGRSPRFSAYGGGDPERLARLRRLGVHVRGYYRAGSLPRRLRAEGVDLALLPSIVPESYSLVLSECRAAGVPVVAFDHGAIADRLRAEGGGLLVAPEAGAAGMAALLSALLAGRAPLPPVPPAGSSGPQRAAREWLGLYRDLGLGI